MRKWRKRFPKSLDFDGLLWETSSSSRPPSIWHHHTILMDTSDVIDCTFEFKEVSTREIKKSYHVHVYQIFRLNLGKRTKLIIFGSLLTTFEVRNIFEATGAVAKIGRLEPKNSNYQIKLRLPESLLHKVDSFHKKKYMLSSAVFLNRQWNLW